MRSYDLRESARDVYQTLDPDVRRAVAAVIAAMLDERMPLVGPTDLSVTRGVAMVGRRVPGTDVVVCYVPAGDHVFVVDIVR